MNIVEWDDTLLTGNAEIDQQHQMLFRVANELHQAILEGSGQEMVGSIADKLSRYSSEHFRIEEQLMVDWGYPQLAQHRRSHEKVSMVVNEFGRSHQSVAPFQVLQFLVSLIRVHIREVDTLFIRWLREHRQDPGAATSNPGRLNLMD